MINKPFPQQQNFVNTIKPTVVLQSKMNESVANYYNFWKKEYLKKNNADSPYNGYLIEMQGTGGTGEEKTTSEAHGYGMIIFSLMAGYDNKAKDYFDGMFNVYNHHRSKINNNLMSWIVSKDESNSKDADSATDGDLDIAYALLMANKQWGSAGEIDYMTYAKKIITDGIKASLVDELNHIRLGDWANIDGYLYTTRPSDWMLSHFRAFYEATEDTFWLTLIDSLHEFIDILQKKYAPTTALMPDFVIGEDIMPAPANFLEAENDGNYNWNACRTPWRFAMDYIHNQNDTAKGFVCKMLDWLMTKTSGKPQNIYNGYTLDGKELKQEEWNKTPAFSAPFVVASMVDKKYQSFLNEGWLFLKDNKSGAYYDRTINLLSLLAISGNWWQV